ncbi:hypothetical protein [Azospirillum picis]|uniref:Uncharacterized protein n=1 Tax=Azospirillum picis TaxID=488438 RepID=A0ABU0MJX5_9PROT|nr:hypothetical protein [Azospirillum picis]MBP2299725.1 hypothetical protein [Azospirillum picis]MDQ0533521.1 hypothetical protein [Azospirillum picis]
MADDIQAPHERAILVPEDASPLDVATAILRSGYLAYVGGDATWSVRIGAVEIVFGTRQGLAFAWPAREPAIPARDIVGPLFLAYHRQSDPGELLRKLRDRRP